MQKKQKRISFICLFIEQAYSIFPITLLVPAGYPCTGKNGDELKRAEGQKASESGRGGNSFDQRTCRR